MLSLQFRDSIISFKKGNIQIEEDRRRCSNNFIVLNLQLRIQYLQGKNIFPHYYPKQKRSYVQFNEKAHSTIYYGSRSNRDKEIYLHNIVNIEEYIRFLNLFLLVLIKFLLSTL